MTLIIKSIPLILVALLVLAHARHRWKTRNQRGPRRPLVSCGVCGDRYERGIPMQVHMDIKHAVRPRGSSK